MGAFNAFVPVLGHMKHMLVRDSVYLIFWDKSTNTDATFFSQLEVLSLHLIYWYTRTNTDAARGTSRGSRTQETHAL